jgi:hypothetical protein
VAAVGNCDGRRGVSLAGGGYDQSLGLLWPKRSGDGLVGTGDTAQTRAAHCLTVSQERGFLKDAELNQTELSHHTELASPELRRLAACG